MKKIIFILLWLLNFNLLVNAQQIRIMGSNIFQIDSSKITTYHFNKIDEQTLIDTSINNLHLFHPAQTEQQPFYFDLGNLGQPVYQFYHWQNVPFGFNPSINLCIAHILKLSAI